VKELLIQLIGVIGILAGIMAFQSNKHSRALGYKITEESIFALQYLLLGGITGAILNVVGAIRNIIFARLGIANKEKELKYARIIIAAIYTVIGLFSWNGIISILIVFAKIISTLAYGTTDMKKMRILIFFSSICWICYNIHLGSIAGALADGFTLTSVIIGMVRYDVRRKAKAA